MNRDCTRCRRPFTPDDLGREESKDMEQQRRSAGLKGVRFLYFHCPGCGMDDIFVDILPLAGESPEDFRARRDEMESVARSLPREAAEVVVAPAEPGEPTA